MLAGAAAAVVVARSWPAVEITSDSQALADVKLARLGEGIDRIRVTDSQGRPVPVAVRSGRLWPKTTLPQGERLHVQVTVRRAGWVSWLVGDSEQVRMTVTTPEAHLTSSVLQPDASGFVRIPFDQPVRSATLAGPGIANGRLSFVVPKRLVATGVRAEGRNRAGVVRVSASPRSWESASAPVRVVWFPASDRPEALVRPVPGSELHPTDPIQLTFSRPVADLLGSDEPTVTPSTPGSWHTIDSHTIAFRPSGAGFGIGVRVAVSLPHSVDVIRGKSTLTGETLSWEVPNGKTLRLQQLFAASGYLPLSWQPSGPDVPRTAAAQTDAAIDPPSGEFSWRFPSTPASLRNLWSEGDWTTMMQGAVMAFEAEHGLEVDGLVGPKVWHAAIADALAAKHKAGGYSYVLVHRNVPQQLELWHDGTVVLQARVNTGVPAAPTPLGTHAVFEHIPVGTMSGRNPDGTRYHDPGIKWISYFNGGEAIHGFNRPTYGFPQSVGCVEAPIDTAGKIWPYTPIGTLVTVSL